MRFDSYFSEFKMYRLYNFEPLKRIEQLMQESLLPIKNNVELIAYKLGGSYALQQLQSNLMINDSFINFQANKTNEINELAQKASFQIDMFRNKFEPISFKLSHELFESSFKINETIRGITGDSFYKNIYNNFLTRSDIYENLYKSKSFFAEVGQLYNDISPNNFAVQNDGTVEVENEILNIEEVTKNINELVANIKEVRYQKNISDYFEFIINLLRKLEEPIRILLLYMILPLFITIYGNWLTNNYFDSKNSINKKAIIKEISKEVLNNLQPQLLQDYRIVTASVLNVRQSNKKDSKLIDNIYLGQTVKVINKKRNWTYIEYIEESTNEKINGWVFSRYLKKFKQ